MLTNSEMLYKPFIKYFFVHEYSQLTSTRGNSNSVKDVSLILIFWVLEVSFWGNN